MPDGGHVLVAGELAGIGLPDAFLDGGDLGRRGEGAGCGVEGGYPEKEFTGDVLFFRRQNSDGIYALFKYICHTKPSYNNR
ncbi:MAG: hypothetical protein K8F58_09305 [Bauldia sp.]|nr:hypothetical protein [Bauldia sp.]